MNRGRRPKRRKAKLIARLHRLMAVQQWNQADLASKLGVSPSTVTRALASKAVSSGFELRATHLIESLGAAALPGVASDHENMTQELHLLPDLYRLLLKLDSKLDTLLAGQPSGAGGSGKG